MDSAINEVWAEILPEEVVSVTQIKCMRSQQLMTSSIGLWRVCDSATNEQKNIFIFAAKNVANGEAQMTWKELKAFDKLPKLHFRCEQNSARLLMFESDTRNSLGQGQHTVQLNHRSD